MAVNQVNLANGEELINLTEDTVSEDTLLEGETAHDASGNQITGKFVPYNPNLLDNWYFADPINQRAQTEYTTAGYTIDRWIIGGISSVMAYKVNERKLVSEGLTDTYVALQEFLEKPATLAGKTVTFSALAVGECSDWIIQMWRTRDNATTPVATSGDWSGGPFKSITFDFPADVLPTDRYRVLVQTRYTLQPYAVKLELGSIQTLAHKDTEGNWVIIDSPPNSALELAKCQRYLLNYDIVAGGVYLIGVAQTAQVVKASIALPTSMRTTPTLIFDPEKWELFDGTTAHPITAIAIHTDSGRTQLTFNITASGLTVGKSYFLRAKTATSVAYSAEL